ncbi:hypothetical protein V5F59_21340 [Xanthobacter autotrophicus DSM 431]|uniref:hypothetical protein n=1 Tax=Xanthobacter nonsaccharivorans TaxID=3119912 RepID=UPI003729C0EB
MRQPEERKAKHGRVMRGAAMVAGALLCAGPALADPLPLPTVDFALKGSLRHGGTLDLAHSQGKMRVEITRPNVPGSVVGILDLKVRRMVMRTPNLPNMALDVELPPEFALGAVSGNGTRVGPGAPVAGEACELWITEAPTSAPTGVVLGPTTACITADGITVRTEVELNGKKQQLFETTTLTRGPQDPKLFQLPPGVQVVKLPKGKLGSALGLGVPPPPATKP